MPSARWTGWLIYLLELLALEDRGRITRSTAIEAAVTLALAELRANGKQSAWLDALVTLPRVNDGT